MPRVTPPPTINTRTQSPMCPLQPPLSSSPSPHFGLHPILDAQSVIAKNTEDPVHTVGAGWCKRQPDSVPSSDYCSTANRRVICIFVHLTWHESSGVLPDSASSLSHHFINKKEKERGQSRSAGRAQPNRCCLAEEIRPRCPTPDQIWAEQQFQAPHAGRTNGPRCRTGSRGIA